jgi:hypothetical protein
MSGRGSRTRISSAGLSDVNILPDGRFMFVQKGDDEGDIEQVNVVLNWFEELKAKAPMKE